MNIGPGIFSELFPFSGLFFFVRKEIFKKLFKKHKMTIALLSLLTGIFNFERRKNNGFLFRNVKLGEVERFPQSIFALKMTSMQISQIREFSLGTKVLLLF